MSLIRAAGLLLVMVEGRIKLRSKRIWPNLKTVLKMRRPKVLSRFQKSGGTSGSNKAKEVIGSANFCPSCGKMIRKKDFKEEQAG
jgi:hypothetical protein